MTNDDENPLEWLMNWDKMVKFLDNHHITSYKVDPNANIAEIRGNVIVVCPEFEAIVSELLKEKTQ